MSLVDTWKCHICGQERPDDKISVYTSLLVIKGKVCGEQNVRHCNDNPNCINLVKSYHFIEK